MSVGTCIICGEATLEGREVCPYCEHKFAPHADIMNAMLKQKPVEYEGIKYGCISAFIIRTRVSHTCKMKTPYILQVELMSKRTHSVTIADPQKVKILEV